MLVWLVCCNTQRPSAHASELRIHQLSGNAGLQANPYAKEIYWSCKMFTTKQTNSVNQLLPFTMESWTDWCRPYHLRFLLQAYVLKMAKKWGLKKPKHTKSVRFFSLYASLPKIQGCYLLNSCVNYLHENVSVYISVNSLCTSNYLFEG